MFVPVNISIGTGGETGTLYHRGFDVPEKLDAFGKQSADMRLPLTQIGGQLKAAVSQQFETEGTTGATGKWKPLSEPYGEWKQAKAPGVPILVGIRRSGNTKAKRGQARYRQSGKMKLSLLSPTSTHVTKRRLLYMPTSPYAGYHESGTSKMPARPPVDLTLTQLRSFDRTFVAWISELIGETGL